MSGRHTCEHCKGVCHCASCEAERDRNKRKVRVRVVRSTGATETYLVRRAEAKA